MPQKINFLHNLSVALGPHSDLEFGRSAMVAVLRGNADARERVEAFRSWANSHDPQLPHDRWFQRVLAAFLNSLPPELAMGVVIAELENAVVPPTPAETLERRANRFRVPGIRHRLMVQARKARQLERLVGTRY